MARVQGPLFSLAASGTVGGLLTARMGKDGAQVIKKAVMTVPPSASQLENRSRMNDALEGFKALSSADKIDWSAWAGSRNISTWVAYFAEWQKQNVQAGNQPLIPDPTTYGE